MVKQVARQRGETSWHLVAVAYVGMIAIAISDNARGPSFPDILKEFALSDVSGALFFTVSSAASLLNNFLAFGWIQRQGAFRTLQLYSVLSVFALGLISLAPRYEVLLLGSSLLGAGLGGVGVSVNLLVAEGAAPAIRRRALSGLHSMYGGAALAAPLSLSAFYQMGWGWRQIFAVLMFLPALVFALTWLGRPPREEGLMSDSGGRGDFLLGHQIPRGAWYYAAVVAFYVVAELAISTRLVLLARREWSYPVAGANQLLALFFAGMLAGRAVMAVLSVRWRNLDVLLVSASLSLVLFMVGLVYGPQWLALAGFTMSIFYPCAIAMIADDMGSLAGYVTSFSILVQSLALMSMHFVVGLMSDAFGLGKALWFGPVCLVFVVILLGCKGRFIAIQEGGEGGPLPSRGYPKPSLPR